MSIIKIIVKKPGESLVMTEVENKLESYQGIVGGYIEHLPFIEDEDKSISLFCNEEGKLDGLTPNFPVMDAEGSVFDIICGPVMFFRDGEDGGCESCTQEDMLTISLQIVEAAQKHRR